MPKEITKQHIHNFIKQNYSHLCSVRINNFSTRIIIEIKHQKLGCHSLTLAEFHFPDSEVNSFAKSCQLIVDEYIKEHFPKPVFFGVDPAVSPDNSMVCLVNADHVESMIISARRNERCDQSALFASYLENLANFIKDESAAEIAGILRDQAELYHRIASA